MGTPSGLAVKKAGPAALVSFVLAGVLVLLSALSFAVVASRASLGRLAMRMSAGPWALPAFLSSWALYVDAVIGVAFVLGAFGSYVHDFFVGGMAPLVWGVGAAVVLTLLNLGPADLIDRGEMGLVALKAGILLLLIFFAFVHLDRAHFSPFVTHGAMSVLTRSGLLFVPPRLQRRVQHGAGDSGRVQHDPEGDRDQHGHRRGGQPRRRGGPAGGRDLYLQRVQRRQGGRAPDGELGRDPDPDRRLGTGVESDCRSDPSCRSSGCSPR